jgi:deoxyribonucleoside regulator
MPIDLEQAELLAQVAHLYFEQGLDQGAIARRLKVSRSSISRLISQARREGIVEIRIHDPLPCSLELASRLKECFGLKEALVLDTARLRQGDILRRVSLLAAKYLDANLQDGDILAMSWGNTLYEIVRAFTPSRPRAVKVVQLVGTLNSSRSEIDGANLARRIAQSLESECFNLSAPLVVENIETRRALLQEPSILEVIDLARRASLALVGIGGMSSNSSAVMRLQLLSPGQMELLRQEEAAGDICAQYYDLSGHLLSDEINQRVVSINLPMLAGIPRVVGVAVGPQKAKAILGALRGHFVNMLIVDDLTAERVLQLDSANPIDVARPDSRARRSGSSQ